MWWTAALRAAQKKHEGNVVPYFDRGRQAAFHILTLNSKL